MAINFILLGILGLLIYVWSQEWIGRWAILPAFLTVLMPNFIDETPLISLGILLAIASLFNFLLHPSKLNMVIAGVGLGAAQLAEPSNLILIPYYLIIIAFFYLISLIRNWEYAPLLDHPLELSDLGRRLFNYLRALVFIFAIAIVIFYVVKVLPDFNPKHGYQQLVNHFQQNIWHWQPLDIAKIIKQPPATMILVGLSLLFFIINFLSSAKTSQKLFWISNNFIELALIIFILFYWSFGSALLTMSGGTITPILPVLYLLISRPLRNLVAHKNQKEIMIVIGHEALSFSVRWLVLLTLLLWYFVNTVYLYLQR